MFNSRLTSKPAIPDTLTVRARDAGTAAAQTAAHTAQAAAQTAALGVTSAAQTAAHGMGQSMRHGVYSARGWAAPRLESAADYCTSTVAPRVADTLRSTARQVSPEDAVSRKSRMHPALSWSLLALAAGAAAGAVAVLVRRQYKAAMEADTESDAVDVDDASEPGATAPGQPATPAQAAATGAEVNGQASTSRR